MLLLQKKSKDILFTERVLRELRSSRLMMNICGIGDKVLIMETKPLSKDKRWRLVEIIEKAK